MRRSLIALAFALSTALASAGAAFASWGGTYTAATGERVMVQVSDAYPVDQTLPQRWANFLSTLVHGPELSTVQLYLAPLSEVQSRCGSDALACYNPAGAELVAPAENPSSDLTAEAVVTHEYGHHVAGSRNDAPWDALDYGAKRWSSYMQVCAKTRAREFFPGAESNHRYQLNPGEGWAEAYRVLNERVAGIAEPPWEVVSEVFYPDETALSLLQEDVTHPWTRNTTSSLSTVLNRRTRTHTFTIATPLDGTLRATATTASREAVSMSLLNGNGSVARGARTLRTTICGARTYKLRVTLANGAGRVRISVSKP